MGTHLDSGLQGSSLQRDREKVQKRQRRVNSSRLQQSLALVNHEFSYHRDVTQHVEST